jgi:hypothetical protein
LWAANLPSLLLVWDGTDSRTSCSFDCLQRHALSFGVVSEVSGILLGVISLFAPMRTIRFFTPNMSKTRGYASMGSTVRRLTFSRDRMRDEVTHWH